MFYNLFYFIFFFGIFIDINLTHGYLLIKNEYYYEVMTDDDE